MAAQPGAQLPAAFRPRGGLRAAGREREPARQSAAARYRLPGTLRSWRRSRPRWPRAARFPGRPASEAVVLADFSPGRKYGGRAVKAWIWPNAGTCALPPALDASLTGRRGGLCRWPLRRR